jgi:hypothetical protein
MRGHLARVALRCHATPGTGLSGEADVGDEAKRRVREAILRHIVINTAASDTPEGIRRWWLPPADATVEPALVQDVLEEIVAAGYMRRRRLPDGGVVYAAAIGESNGVD